MLPAHWLGPAFIILFVLFDALKHVFVGHQAQAISPAILAFSAYMLVVIITVPIAFYSRRKQRFSVDLKDVFWLNLSTAIAWISLFYALKYLEPAIVGSVVNGFAPMMITLLDSRLRTRQNHRWQEHLVNFGIAAATILLLTGSLYHASGMPEIYSQKAIFIGIALTLVTSLSAPLIIIFTKRLTSQGCTSIWLIPHRSYLLLLSCALLIWMEHQSLPFTMLKTHIDTIVIIALTGVFLPLFLMQNGIRLCEPVTVGYILALSPIIIYIMQLADSRISISPLSLIGVTLMSVLILTHMHVKKAYGRLPS